MSLIDLILSRRSIRSYEPREISQDTLRQILEAGRQAPSAANRQPIRFVVVKDVAVKKKLIAAFFNRFLQDAPVIVVGCGNEESALTGKWAVIDAVISMENMVLAAWSLGVGSCWIGAFKEDVVKKLLNIPKKWKVVALLTLGYPAEHPKPIDKKPFEELFSFDSF